MGVYGLVAFAGRGLPGRFDPATRTIIKGWNDLWSRRDVCNTHICSVGADSQPVSFVLWGDSHAGALAPVVEQIASERRLRGLVAYGNACAPVLKLRRYDLNREECVAFSDSVLALIDASHVGMVMLHARWGQLVEGVALDPLAAPVLLTPSRRIEEDSATLDTQLGKTLDQLAQRRLKVIIVASVPEVEYSVPSTLARMQRAGIDIELNPRTANFMKRQRRAFDILRRAAAEHGATLVFPHELLCNSSSCAVAREGYPLYSDDSHLSVHGAAQIKPLLERAMGLTSQPDIAHDAR
jgi:hypothetical protein